MAPRMASPPFLANNVVGKPQSISWRVFVFPSLGPGGEALSTEAACKRRGGRKERTCEQSGSEFTQWHRRVPNAVPRPPLMRCAPALVAATPAPGSPGVADGVPGQTVANPNATRALVKSSKVRAVGCGSALKKKYPLTLLFSNPAPVWRRRVPPEDRGRRLHGAQLSGRGRTHARRPRLRTRRCLHRLTRPETRRQRGCPATPLDGGSGGSPCESPPLPKHVNLLI